MQFLLTKPNELTLEKGIHIVLAVLDIWDFHVTVIATDVVRDRQQIIP